MAKSKVFAVGRDSKTGRFVAQKVDRDRVGPADRVVKAASPRSAAALAKGSAEHRDALKRLVDR